MKKYSDEYYTHLADLYASDYDEACIENPFLEEQCDPQFEEYEESDYENKRKQVFEKLVHVATNSSSPVFENKVLEIARKYQHYSESSNVLSLNKEFYVYVAMDTSQPGPWEYILPGDFVISFPFLPIYVGKGKNKRMLAHVSGAYRRKRAGKKLSRKENKILKIEKEGFEVKVQRISRKSIEAVALAKEYLLIGTIGRTSTKRGPLTNIKNTPPGSKIWGGGHSKETKMLLSILGKGRKPTAEARKNMSIGRKRAWDKVSVEDRKLSPELIAKQAAANIGKKRTPEQVEAMREAARKSRAKKGTTQKQRDAVRASNRRRKGQKRNPESVDRGAEKNRGKKRTDEQRANMRKPKSAEGCANMKAAAIKRGEKRKGIPWSPARRAAYEAKWGKKK